MASLRVSLPTWAEFELGRAPVYWKTSNGLPPSPVSCPPSIIFFFAQSSILLCFVGTDGLGGLRVGRQGEGLTLFYNPAATKMAPNDVFGVAFNGGFNQPIMCGGEPRQMTLQVRGSADPPIYTIRIRVPQHGAPPTSLPSNSLTSFLSHGARADTEASGVAAVLLFCTFCCSREPGLLLHQRGRVGRALHPQVQGSQAMAEQAAELLQRGDELDTTCRL
jgi:hypothetical protein